MEMILVEMLVLHCFTWIFHPGYSLYYSSEVHLALKNLIIKLHVLGFSSRRITTMIQFLSSVCVSANLQAPDIIPEISWANMFEHEVT